MPVRLGTQYYRAPFPNACYWEDDLRRMRDSGLDTVQLWVLWAWVEAVPGQFVFDDYDRLVRLAEKVGLNLVLSTIAEIQPYWIFREVPGCELVNHRGETVYSVNRGETHFGCTPGGCTDHPGVWERMRAFLETVGRRYAPEKHLVGWDAWNELRWNVEAEGRCCYCEHTVRRYKQWLEKRYGSLEGLNAAWQRRYGQWDEVWPGKRGNLPYTDMMPWQHFLTERSDEHAEARYNVLKALDPVRPVTVHGGQPSPGYVGNPGRWTALDRGNDWVFAERLDGVGCSSFPLWGGMDDADFALRVEFVKSASGAKRVWLSEVQGGRAANGFQVHKPVPARDQQRWIWNGYACGADTILFWCWRDEVFGRESAGFGIIGKDGLADQRLRELKVTGQALAEYGDLLEAYRPDPTEIGVLFSPQSYYLHYAQDETAQQAYLGLQTYCRALVRLALPYTVFEDAHLTSERLAGLKLLFLPRCTALPDDAVEALKAWVRAGGTLCTESECGAYGPEGLYRYSEERFLAELAGVADLGRRALDAKAVEIVLDGQPHSLRVNQWLTPLAGPPHAVCHAPHPEGSLLLEAPVEQGRVFAFGGYAGDDHRDRQGDDPAFEALVTWAAQRAGVQPGIRVLEPQPGPGAFIHVRTGTSGARRLLFVFAPEGIREARLASAEGLFKGCALTEMRGGSPVTPERATQGHAWRIPVPEIGFAALIETA
jgi:beta-galactosidase